MKRLLLLLLLLQAITSCNKLLDKKPTDFVDPASFYNSEEELNMALAAVYDPLGNEYMYGSSLWFQFGICTDEAFYAFSSNAYSAPMFYQYDYTNPYVGGIWQQCYIGIERANMLIENINKPAMDETKRQAILGEALFLRAYYHFILVSNYGDVPLKLKSSDNVNAINIPRTPAKQVYEQIVTDMKEAEGKVNAITSIGNSSHVSKTAVRGILARVYLYMAGAPMNDQSKYADALYWAQQVDAGNEHELLTTYNATITNSAYSQIFINQCRDIYDIKECIWEVDFYAKDADPTYAEMGKVGTMNLGCTNIDTGRSSSNIKTTIKLYRLYENGDQRRDWTIAPFSYSSTANPLTRTYYTSTNIIGRDAGKWRRFYEPSNFVKLQFTNGTNFPLLRYADVLLMQAEAENEVNGPTSTAYTAINKVRRRAYGLPVNVASTVADVPAGLTPVQFRQFIRDERARELCFEGLRKGDLLRWGIFTSVMNEMVTEINASNASFTNKSRWITGYTIAASSGRYQLLPVPALELNVNKGMTQNPGW